MAISTIPNLWPEIKVSVVTPYAVLQTQASLLSQATKGLLTAEIVTRNEGKKSLTIFK